MSYKVKVSIDGVNDHEINQLNRLIEALPNSYFHADVEQTTEGSDYVVSVDAATSTELKDVLYVILRVVEAKRIALDM